MSQNISMKFIQKFYHQATGCSMCTDLAVNFANVFTTNFETVNVDIEIFSCL